MKVAFIMPTHFDLNSVIAGGERYAYGLAKAMSEKAETVLFSFAKEEKTFRDGNLTVRHCKTLFYAGGIANPFSFEFLGELKDFDVIHCLQFRTLVTDFAMIAGISSRKRVFTTDLAGGTYYCISHKIPLWKKTTGFLYISEYNRELNRSVTSPYRILFGGVDTDFFVPSENTEPRNKFLFVGRIFRAKGIHDLIDAATDQTSVEVAGTCHEPNYMKELKSKIGTKPVTFHEGIPDADLLKKIQTSTAVVLPSLVDGGFTSAIEAMACGTPVIGTQLGSLPEVVEDGVTGLLVPPGNPQALREKMQFLLQNPQKAAEMGKNARQRVLERYTWKQVADRCLDAYRNL